MTRWGYNSFRDDLATRLAAEEAGVAFGSVRFDDARGAWVADSPDEGSAPPSLLQGRRLVVDVSDRFIDLYPLGLEGRFRLSAWFVGAGSQTTKRADRLVYDIGRALLEGQEWRVDATVSTTLPVLELTLTAFQASAAYLQPDGADQTELGGTPVWLLLDSFPIDEVVARNNSTIPDPLPLENAESAGLLVAWQGQRLVLAVASSRVKAEAALAAWQERRESERSYWAEVGERLTIRTPDQQLDRQLRHSVHNSLFSRSLDEDGRDIFLHGRRDRGYADAAHLHQSYQMHLPALAAGEAASVRDEIRSFCALQDEQGWIERAPRPIRGTSLYVGRYTGAHLLLAAARYLAWSGDTAFFDEQLESGLDAVPRTIRERVDRAASDLTAHQFRGLIAPCGWADAWNPDVRAQGQISATAVLALREWAEALRALGDAPAAVRGAVDADRIRNRMRELLIDPATGLVAEHVFDDVITGGTPEDYWVHTQVWSALAGVTVDGRALDRSATDCLTRGMSIAPESAFDQAYVAASTDSEADLPVESTATWLMATWPEVTHLYAMAELQRGRPDAALDAVRRQLPERLHAEAAVCMPMYYAEKYLYPGTRPWLCTWAGDPSLIEVVLTGFFGVRPTPDGLVVAPQLPADWLGGTGSANFVWRDRACTIELTPDLPARVVEVGDARYAFGAILEVLDCSAGAVHLRVSTQSIA